MPDFKLAHHRAPPGATKKATAKHPDSKKQMVLELIGRKQGATAPEIAKATSWMNHSIRDSSAGRSASAWG